MFGRIAGRRLAAEIQGLIHGNPHGKRQVVVGQFAKQQAIQRTAIADVRHAAHRQVFAIGDRPGQMDGGHHLPGNAGQAAQFLVILQAGDQLPHALGRFEIDVGRFDRLFQARLEPQPKRGRVELLEPLVQGPQFRQHVAEAVPATGLRRHQPRLVILGQHADDAIGIFRPHLPPRLFENHRRQLGLGRGQSPQVGRQAMNRIELRHELRQPIGQVAAIDAGQQPGLGNHVVRRVRPVVATGPQQPDQGVHRRQPLPGQACQHGQQFLAEGDRAAFGPDHGLGRRMVPSPERGGPRRQIAACRHVVVDFNHSSSA